HETLLDKASNNPGTIVEKIGNDHPERRFYIDLAGELRLSQAVPQLLEFVKNTSDIAIIRSILRSLGFIGDPRSAGTVGGFLQSEHKTLVETAVSALGKIATDEAMRLLAERLGEDDEKDTSILDVFANVGSGFCLQRLKETLKSTNVRIRNYGKSKLTALGKVAAPVLIPNLFTNDSDLQIHSLNILQEIGDEVSVMPVRQLLDNQPEDANVRFAAYETLANLPTRKMEYVLAAGLTDSDDGIRLAAARAVENSFNTVLLAGINNMIKKRDAEAIRIIKAVIDAQT
ncbi:MAG: HEAT repeat domain-containing protein, partial [Proteobacteria bacterium]|nr:HEAT repeat domain-containing protein [Pseudomonadota bacterium]